ncbi:MAG: hypothetical protein LBC23_05825, partial [Coriobacteriales bacterium]|nr:hypothetical protein [Coriobacteriales bacterium]
MPIELFRSTSLLPLGAEVSAQDFLDAARGAGEYLRDFAVEGERGIFWRQAPGAEPQIEFYAGSAGIVLFYLQLAAATGESAYLEDAIRGGEFIVSELRRTGYNYPIASAFAEFEPYRHNETTFYAGGFAGVAFVLIELAKA